MGDLRLKDLGAVGLGEDGPADVRADLARVDVKGGDHLDVARKIAADLRMHQTDHAVSAPLGGVVVNALDECAGAISHPRNGDADAALVRHNVPCLSLADLEDDMLPILGDVALGSLLRPNGSKTTQIRNLSQ